MDTIHEAVSAMTGTEIFGIISICIFFLFFAGTILWVASLKKKYLNHMENLPLDDEGKSDDKDSGPEEDPHGPLLDHEYDGIRELDNNLPRWWLWLFLLTTIFSLGYIIYYHVAGVGDSSATEYAKEMQAAQAAKAAAVSQFEASIPTLQPSTDDTIIASGHDLYMKDCAACHRADGGGLVGPDLTSNHWIHGSKFSDNVTVIWNGVPSKGMPTWSNSLKASEIYAVASYIYTLRGAKLATPGKPPMNLPPSQN
jgi:cytochrome c oxidase cbb3-type subunit 3